MEQYEYPGKDKASGSRAREAYFWTEEQRQPDQAFHVAYVTLKRGFTSPLHRHHDFGELFWVDKGQGWHLFNGEQYRLRAHDLVIIRPGDVHALDAHANSKLSVFVTVFSEATYDFIFSRYGKELSAVVEGMTGESQHIVHLTSRQQDLVGAATEALIHSPRKQLFLDRYLVNVFSALALDAQNNDFPDLPDWLQSACIEIRYPEHFSQGTKALADLTGRSREHVARELKRTLGKTPTELINEARMNYAERQLAITSTPIVDIAFECGFESLSRFYDIFRRRYGVPPRRYREQHQHPGKRK